MELEKTKDYKPYKYPFRIFNPVQTEVLHILKKNSNNNLVLSANTSSGKTICAEFLVDQTLKSRKKVIYLSPLKALAEERYEDWQERFEDEDICILTGDYTGASSVVIDKKLRDADIIIMTSEMLDHKTRNYKDSKSSWLRSVGLIVVDEAHIIGSEKRGAVVEISLMRFSSKLNKKARILFLSATMSNRGDFRSWLQTLNGKTTDVVSSTWRPVELSIHYEPYESVVKKSIYGGTVFDYYNTEKNKVQAAVDVILEKVNTEKFLVFVHSKATGRSVVKLLEENGVDTVFHSADLSRQNRRDIENEFKDKDGDLRVLVSTSTLAWGVNLPARNVVIVGTKRGMDEVDSLDIIQMAGRAGRYGIDDAGDVYLVVLEALIPYWTKTLENPKPVLSTLEAPKVLVFHTVAEINNGVITNDTELIAWYHRTLRYLQTLTQSLYVKDGLIPALRRILMISDGDKLTTTTLGQISSMLYFCPYDINSWYHNFRKLLTINNITDLHLAWALFNVPKNESWLPKNLQDELRKFRSELSHNGISIGSDKSLTHMYVGYERLSGEEGSSMLSPIRREVVYDFDRTVVAVKMILGTFKKSNRLSKLSELVDEAGLRIKYAIPQDAVKLVRIPGIGSKRASVLIGLGLHSAKDIRKSKKLLRENFSDRVGKSIYDAATKYLKRG